MTSQGIDWSQLWYPGPRREYTADEMARAGGDRPSRTLVAVATLYAAQIAVLLLQASPPAATAQLTGFLVAYLAAAATAARWLWMRPWRWPLLQVTLALVGGTLAFVLGLRWRVPDAAERHPLGLPLMVMLVVIIFSLWAFVVWRSQQIDGRLREQAERERSIEMARRLAAAQIEPHFLYNTLASVQHWVQTQDPRAAPLLDALTGYLRATLPLFDRPLLAAADELVAVRRYLEVMQARMGARLAWQIDVDDAAASALLPPGVLLTLVENAIEHGIEPRLAGGHIAINGRVDAERCAFAVVDDGPGPAADAGEGVGLANVRQRLALACGDAARLTLASGAAGGCRAELSLPYRKEDR